MELPDERATLAAFVDATWARAMRNDITEEEAKALQAGLILLAATAAAKRHLGLFA